MAITVIHVSAILAILIGILILIWPKILRIGLGIYLILLGILQLVGW